MKTEKNTGTIAFRFRQVLLYYIIILRDYRRIYGPSLTETSLCIVYLYYVLKTMVRNWLEKSTKAVIY